MTRLTNYINEAKQVGSLYHIVGLEQLAYIVKNNKIQSQHYWFISTTRSKMLNWYSGGNPLLMGKLELDGDKLSEKYKIEPYVHKNVSHTYYKEKEEKIDVDKIPDIWKYTKRFILIQDNIEKWWEHIPAHNKHIKKFGFNSISELIRKVPVKVYIQKKTQIKRDETLLNQWLQEWK